MANQAKSNKTVIGHFNNGQLSNLPVNFCKSLFQIHKISTTFTQRTWSICIVHNKYSFGPTLKLDRS